jgi:AcrR family transcriptional regulator
VTPRAYKSAAREEAAERTRERIIRAAARILATKGGGARFSLEAAARAAGVTRLTVYNQFGSRRALLEALFDERAASAGLLRIPQAMSQADPHAALRTIIEIFCGFWNSDPSTIGWLHAAGSTDADLAESVRERNERRRKLLSVLVDRMKHSVAKDPSDLVDILFALTGFQFSAELRTRGRTPRQICAIIQDLAADTVRRYLQP